MNSPTRPSGDIPASVIASTLLQRERFTAAYSVLLKGVEEHAFPGAAFGVFFDGEVVALDGVGRFTYEPDSPAVHPSTVYDLASVTKVMATTAAAMLLYDHGKLDLDQPLGDILPAFVIGSSSPRQRCDVTLRSLLGHSSGLPAYARLFETSRTPTDLLAACLHVPLEAAPGARVEYSDIGFILLGKAMEILMGESLEVFCRREIFTPLEVATTRYQPPPSWRSVIPPTVHDMEFRKRVIQGEVHDENCSVLGGVSGHAGLFSNALDVLTFASCIVNGGRAASGRQIIQHGTIELFASRQTPPPGSSRALGWDTPSGASSSGQFFGANAIGHLGYTGTSLWIDRDRKLAITLLTNRTWPDRSSQAIRSIRPAFHDAVLTALRVA